MKIINRAQRRQAKQEQERFFRQVNKGFDPARPLDFKASSGGYVHNPLYCRNPEGGVCDRPNQPGLGYFCSACDRLVPSTECRRKS